MRLFFNIILAFLSILCFPQPVEKDIINYNLYEQVDLNTDRETYLSGETIWLKVNTYEGNFKIPVKLSKIVYVELLTQDNIPVQQEKLFLEDGKGSGYIEIPRHLKTDYYYIRAYTNYMKNYGYEHFYHQRINVINPFEKLDNNVSDVVNIDPLIILFYPEGGLILSNQENIISYRVQNQNGKGVNFTGYLTDYQENILDTIHTIKNGFGYFKLNPLTNQKYFIEYYINNEKFKVKLPNITNEGIKLKVNNLGDSLQIMLISNNNLPYSMKLTASYPGLEYLLKKINTNKNQIVIPKTMFYSGICEIMLYNESTILSSRPVFISNNDSIYFDVKVPKNTFSKREKVNIDIKSHLKNNNSINSNIGISVTLLPDSLQSINAFYNKYSFKTQYNKLLFSTTNVRSNLIDTLILAHNQSNIKTGRSNYLPEMRDDLINGTIINKNTKAPAEKVTVYQSIVDSVGQLKVTKTNQKGQFYIILNKYNNNSDIVISVKDTTNDYIINLEDEFIAEYIKIVKEIYIPEKSLDNYIQRKMINVQVIDAYSDYISKNENAYNLNEVNFYGNPDISYLFSDYIKLPNVDEFIFEIVRGVLVVRRNKKRYIKIISANTQNIIGDNPLIIIDGVPVYDYNEVLNLKPENLKTISAVWEKYFYQDQMYDGILDIVSKEEKFSKLKIPKNANQYEIKGAQRNIIYPEILNDRIPDYRDAQYWNGSLTTDIDGNASVSFSAGDAIGTYIIKCFGYSENGIFGINFENIINIEN